MRKNKGFQIEEHGSVLKAVIDKISENHAIEAAKLRKMAEFGNRKACLCHASGDYKKASAWKNWTYYKELEAEYHESRI